MPIYVEDPAYLVRSAWFTNRNASGKCAIVSEMRKQRDLEHAAELESDAEAWRGRADFYRFLYEEVPVLGTDLPHGWYERTIRGLEAMAQEAEDEAESIRQRYIEKPPPENKSSLITLPPVYIPICVAPHNLRTVARNNISNEWDLHECELAIFGREYSAEMLRNTYSLLQGGIATQDDVQRWRSQLRNADKAIMENCRMRVCDD